MPESSLERGVAILRQFGRSRTHLTAADLGGTLGIPRSSLHRLLNEMVDLRLLQRDGEGRYALDTGVLMLGYEFLAGQDIVALARPVLEGLREQTGWTTNLAVREGTSIVYLVRYRGDGAVTENVTVGASLPAHATLMGRLMLAGLSDQELASTYEGHVFADRGDAVPGSLQALYEQIAQDRETAVLATDSYYEAGLAVAAASVRKRGGGIVCAINATRVGASSVELDRVLPAVIEAANTISALLGGPSVTSYNLIGERACPNITAA